MRPLLLLTVLLLAACTEATASRVDDRTFRIEVRAVLANDEFVLQLADGTATLAGTSREWRTVGVFRIEGGKIAECWLVPFDQYSFDQIWS